MRCNALSTIAKPRPAPVAKGCVISAGAGLASSSRSRSRPASSPLWPVLTGPGARLADDPSKVWTQDELIARGEKVYTANCAACHQPNGKGGGAIKALDASPVVLDSDRGKQIHVLLNGQNNIMPAWKQLSDTEIAAVITFTKNHWSNKTGQLVQPAEVLAARK